MSPQIESVIDCDYSIEGNGPALFLIHGIGAAKDGFRLLAPYLTEHFTVVRYDLRGHGNSPKTHAGFGLDELVNDLERVRERTGFEQAHFSGHSLGGMIGPAYARKFPNRVLSLGLLSTAAFRTEDDSAKVRGVVKAMQDNGIPKILETLTQRWFTDAYIQANPDVVQRRLQQVIETNAEIFLNVFRIYAQTEMQPWLHEIQAPSLVLTGENDAGCNPRLNKKIADALPNSELILLPELKHSILLEAPQAVAEHTRRFINAIA